MVEKWSKVCQNPHSLISGLGGVSPPPSITPLSLKLDYSNFVQNYFGIR